MVFFHFSEIFHNLKHNTLVKTLLHLHGHRDKHWEKALLSVMKHKHGILVAIAIIGMILLLPFQKYAQHNEQLSQQAEARTPI